MEKGIEGAEDQRGHGFHNDLFWVGYSYRKYISPPSRTYGFDVRQSIGFLVCAGQ